MSARVYIVINTEEGKTRQIVKMLRGNADVERVEVLEGPPDIIVAMEAKRRQKLARSVIRALTTIENLTADTQVLPVKETYTSHRFDKPTQRVEQPAN
jgi:hypothetical protein